MASIMTRKQQLTSSAGFLFAMYYTETPSGHTTQVNISWLVNTNALAAYCR